MYVQCSPNFIFQAIHNSRSEMNICIHENKCKKGKIMHRNKMGRLKFLEGL